MVNQWELLESLICFIFFNTLDDWRVFQLFAACWRFFLLVGVDRTRCWADFQIEIPTHFFLLLFVLGNINIRTRAGFGVFCATTTHRLVAL